jgi:hypothetical protein
MAPRRVPLSPRRIVEVSVTAMDESDLQEHLLRLYLRLNGFFTSDFVVHSPRWAKNKAEIDALAVRFPWSREPEREIEPETHLDLSKRDIELAICEAKSTELRFNEALYADIGAVKTILRWAGMFNEDEVEKVAPHVQEILTPEKDPQPVMRRTQAFNGVVIRSLLFCPKLEHPRRNQPWFVGARTIFPFIFSYLAPKTPRMGCATNYGAVQWAELAGLVKFFKEWGHCKPPTFEDLAESLLT